MDDDAEEYWIGRYTEALEKGGGIGADERSRFEAWVELVSSEERLAAAERRAAAAEAGNPLPPQRPDWSTVAEVAERHRLAPKTVRAAIASKKLKAHDGPPKPYRIRRADEDAWAESRRSSGRREPKKQAPNRSSPAASTFRDLARKAK